MELIVSVEVKPTDVNQSSVVRASEPERYKFVSPPIVMPEL